MHEICIWRKHAHVLTVVVRDRGMLRRCTVLNEHAETLHGIVRLIIIRVAPFRRPLGIFSLTAFVDAAKQNVVWLSLNLPEVYFTRESIFWLSDAFADGGGTKGAS